VNGERAVQAQFFRQGVVADVLHADDRVSGVAVPRDEERLGGRAGAELAEHGPSGDLVAGADGQRVLLGVGYIPSPDGKSAAF
jgi:hypothetical protein